MLARRIFADDLVDGGKPLGERFVHIARTNLWGAASRSGLGSELAARITEECFYSLEAPVLRVGGYDVPYPPSKLEEDYLPDLDRVLDAVDRSFGW